MTYKLEFISRGSGFFVNEAAGQALGEHRLVYRDVSGDWMLADADAVATMPVVGITMSAIPMTRRGTILLQGYISDATWTWTAGGELYASTTAGEITQVAPTTPDIPQQVGIAVDATTIYFDSKLVSSAIAAHAASHEPGGADEVNDIDIGNTGVLLSAHEARHVRGGADDIDSALDARAIALANQGEIVFRAAGANTLSPLATGVAGQALLTGGVGADPSWGAPAPAVHAASHSDGAADEIEIDDLAGAAGAAGEIVESDGAAMSFVEPDGRYAPLAHAASHLDGAADEIDVADLSGAGGATGEIIESDGAALSYVEPDGRYDPAAHVLATTGPHTNELPLTDLAAGARGEIIQRGAADWEVLGVGVAGQSLISGGVGADNSWAAPAPAAHAPSHKDGGADELDVSELAGALGAAGEIVETDGAALSFVEPDGRYTPAAHQASHNDGGADEIEIDTLAGANGAAGEIVESDGAAMSFVEPDGRYTPAAHEASHVSGGADDIDSALDGRAITLTTQGDVVYASGVNTLARLAAGSAGQTLQTGGAGANPSWTWSKELDNAPDATDTGNGIFTNATVGENVIAGDVLYLKADGKYWKADADSAATMPALVMAMAIIAADASGDLLHMGYYREDSRWNWTVGNGEDNLLFVHTTAGDVVQLANQPAGSGDQVQVVGHVVTADVVFFNPSYELVEVA